MLKPKKDEDFDGNWVYDTIEVDDGSIKDKYPKQIKILKQALQRLEAIDNANPSEALEELKELHELAYGNEKTSWKIDDIRMSSHIKQALLKAQEQDKVLEILKPNLRLVGNCLQARVPLVDEADLWVFVKEITNEEELDLLKKILGQTQI